MVPRRGRRTGRQADRRGKAASRGQGLVEYAVLLALLAIVVVAVLALMGRQIQHVFQNVIETLQGP